MDVMITRWGKDMNMRALRSLDDEVKQNKKNQEDCSTYWSEEPPKGKVKCRLCGSEDTKLYFRAYNNFTYYECNHCKALFLANLPHVKDMYENEESSNASFYMDENTFEKRVEIISKPKVDFVLEIMKKHELVPKKWIDVGPGGSATGLYQALRHRSNRY